MIRRVILLFLLLVTPFTKGNAISRAKNDSIWAKSYIVMEQKSRTVMEEKEMYYTQSVASISKIMTAIVALESPYLDFVIIVPSEITKAYGSTVYLKVGTSIPFLELVYALLLRSGNDAAIAIAMQVSGNVPSFVELMNEKAVELGMRHTVFVNPHGLDQEDGGNISCAYDMALIMAYALENPLFRTITGSKTFRSSSYGMWENKNRLLSLYSYTTGGKTGYTTKAKRTLVSSAKQDESEFIIVTINCGSDFLFHQQKYESFFSKYRVVTFVSIGISLQVGYQVYSQCEIYRILTIEEYHSSRLRYEINEKKQTMTLFLVSQTGQKQWLGELSIIGEQSPPSLWDDFLQWVKGVFHFV